MRLTHHPVRIWLIALASPYIIKSEAEYQKRILKAKKAHQRPKIKLFLPIIFLRDQDKITSDRKIGK